jgi:hypothetical protein
LYFLFYLGSKFKSELGANNNTIIGRIRACLLLVLVIACKFYIEFDEVGYDRLLLDTLESHLEVLLERHIVIASNQISASAARSRLSEINREASSPSIVGMVLVAYNVLDGVLEVQLLLHGGLAAKATANAALQHTAKIAEHCNQSHAACQRTTQHGEWCHHPNQDVNPWVRVTASGATCQRTELLRLIADCHAGTGTTAASNVPFE